MKPFYTTPEDFDKLLKKLSFWKLYEIQEFLSALIFFAGRSQFKYVPEGGIDPSEVIDCLNWRSFEAIESVKISVWWLGRQSNSQAKPSKQRFRTIRKQLARWGLFQVEEQAPKQGVRSALRPGMEQPITRVFNLNHRAIVLMIRAVAERMENWNWQDVFHQEPQLDEFLMLDKSKFDKAKHTFSFLYQWHRKNFGWNPSDSYAIEERKEDHGKWWDIDLNWKAFSSLKVRASVQLSKLVGYLDERYDRISKAIDEKINSLTAEQANQMAKATDDRAIDAILDEFVDRSECVEAPKDKAEPVFEIPDFLKDLPDVVKNLLASVRAKANQQKPGLPEEQIKAIAEKRRTEAIEKYNAAAGHSEAWHEADRASRSAG